MSIKKWEKHGKKKRFRIKEKKTRKYKYIVKQ